MAVRPYVVIEPYADVAFAEAYFAQRMDVSLWTALADADSKKRVLCAATQYMDLLAYSGYKNDQAAPREFPRNGDPDIPYCVSQACCEEALALLNGKTMEKLYAKAGIASESTGDVSTSYTGIGPAQLLGENRGFLSPVSLRLMTEWLRDDDSFFMDRVS